MNIIPFDKKNKGPNLVEEILSYFRRRYVICGNCDNHTFTYSDEDGVLRLRCAKCEQEMTP